MFRAGQSLDRLEMIKNPIFAQNINDICAVCFQKHKNYRTSSMQDMLPAEGKIEVYKILESISLFKYSVKTPQLLCLTCSFKLLNIYEFQQMCNKSYFYFNNYFNQKDTQDIYKIEIGDVGDVETNSENEQFIEEVRDNNFPQERVENEQKQDLIGAISESPTLDDVSISTKILITSKKILPLRNNDEKNDISRVEDSDAEDDTCKLEIESIEIHNLGSGSEGSIKSIQKSPTKIHESVELTVSHSFHLDKQTKEHLGLTKNECYIDLKKDVQNFKCTICGSTFKSNHALRFHKHAYTAGRQFKCSQCGKAFATCLDLKEHTTIHTSEQLFCCEVCAKPFKDEQALTSHMVTHINLHFNDAEKISRESEQTTTISPESEIVRVGIIAKDGVITERNRIDHQVGSTAELTEHGAHSKEPLGLDKKESCIDARKGSISELVCKYCNKVFGRKQALISHENLHTGEKPYKCDQCMQAFTSPQGLDSHKIIHNPGRRFCCKLCGKTCNHKQALTIHMETHTNARSHVCSICNKGFNHKSGLIRHVKIHNYSDEKISVQKPYTCEVNLICSQCPKAYVTRKGLSYHKLGHRTERPFVCNICAKTFKDRGGLNLHMKSHLNARSYVCSICGKGFNSNSNMRVHMRVHMCTH